MSDPQSFAQPPDGDPGTGFARLAAPQSQIATNDGQNLAEEYRLNGGAPSGTGENEASAGLSRSNGRSVVLGSSAFYDRLLAKLDPRQPVAIYVPRWHGVYSATLNLFNQVLPIPPMANLTPFEVSTDEISFYVNVLLASNVKHFIFSGGDLIYIAIAKAVLRQDPSIRFDLLWHSNFLQMGEPHDWNLLRHWLREAEDGVIKRIGVVKSGLDQLFRQFGLDAVFIPNIVRVAPETIAPTSVDDVVGIWLSGSSSYRKLPHAMIAAVKAMHNVYLKGSGLGAAGLALVSGLGIPFLRLFETAIPQEQLYKEISTTALSLYVTISECSPMLPLESLALGVPCLVGPASHTFRDHEILRRALIVEQPYNSTLIAEMAASAIRDKNKIVTAYRGYAAEQQQAAAMAMTRFLA